jgi:hypothetical protein
MTKELRLLTVYLKLDQETYIDDDTIEPIKQKYAEKLKDLYSEDVMKNLKINYNTHAYYKNVKFLIFDIMSVLPDGNIYVLVKDIDPDKAIADVNARMGAIGHFKFGLRAAFEILKIPDGYNPEAIEKLKKCYTRKCDQVIDLYGNLIDVKCQLGLEITERDLELNENGILTQEFNKTRFP